MHQYVIFFGTLGNIDGPHIRVDTGFSTDAEAIEYINSELLAGKHDDEATCILANGEDYYRYNVNGVVTDQWEVV